jgi:hypothetical protein
VQEVGIVLSFYLHVLTHIVSIKKQACLTKRWAASRLTRRVNLRICVDTVEDMRLIAMQRGGLVCSCHVSRTDSVACFTCFVTTERKRAKGQGTREDRIAEEVFPLVGWMRSNRTGIQEVAWTEVGVVDDCNYYISMFLIYIC